MLIEHEEIRLQAMIFTLQLIDVPEDNSKNFKPRKIQDSISFIKMLQYTDENKA